jgi:hypothetical protein
MAKTNNPYARPIDATKESAMRVGDYYGTRATDKAINHAAGARNIAPASRYQAVGNADPTAKPAPAPKPTKKAKAKVQPTVEPTHSVGSVTAEDLFEW